MEPAKTPERYTGAAILVHWLMALLLVTSFGVGVFMVNLPISPQRLKLFNWHKWLGIVILGLAAFRLCWRIYRRPPVQPPMPRWQRIANRGVHWLLYGLLFAVPLIGWAYTSAFGVSVVLFALLPLPDLVSANRPLAQFLKAWHATLAWSLVAVSCLHIVAAFKHHFIDQDGLLFRMLPQRTAKGCK